MPSGTKVGEAYLDIRAETGPFNKDVKKLTNDLSKGGSSGALSGSFKKLGAAAAASFSVGMVAGLATQGLKKSILAASDLGEAENVSKLVFGDVQAEVQAFAEASREITGLSTGAALGATTQFGGLLKNVGFARDETVGLSQDLTVLAADMGSAFNVDTEEAIMAITAGLRGESEQLKKFNVFLSEADVKTEALNLGLIKQGDTLSNNEKAQARLSLIMKQTDIVSGDFANTLGESLPNQLKVLESGLNGAAATIGQEFLPMALDVVKWANDSLPAALEVVIPAMRDTADVVRGVGLALVDVNDFAQQFTDNGLVDLGKGLFDVLPGTRELGEAFDFFKDRGADARKEIERQANLLPSAKAAYEELQTTLNAADSGGVDGVTGDVEELAEETLSAADAAEKLEDSWSDLFDLFGESSSIDKQRQDLAKLRDEIDEQRSDGGNSGIGLADDAGRENRDAVRELADGYSDLAESMLEADPSSIDAVNESLAVQRQTLIDTAVDFGATEAQAQNYIDTTLRFPTELHTDVNMVLHDEEVRRAIREFESMQVYIDATIRTGGQFFIPGAPSSHEGSFSTREQPVLIDRDEWIVPKDPARAQEVGLIRNSQGDNLYDTLGAGGTTVNQTFVTRNVDEQTLASFAKQMMSEYAA